MKPSYKSMHVANLVDRAGALKAQMALLGEQLAEIENELRTELGKSFHGQLYDAVRIQSTTHPVAWKAIAQKLNPSRQLVKAHTGTAELDYFKFTARKLP